MPAAREPDPDLIATWYHALGFATLEAVDRRMWRALGRFDGTPLAVGWQPPAFDLVTRADGAPLPVPDVIKSGAPAPVMSARAAEVLAPLWGAAVEWLPLAVGTGTWLAANPVEVVAALDPARSRVRRFESTGRVMAIEEHVFTAAARPPVFKDVLVPELATFVGAATLQAFATAGLTGLDARVVWPAGAVWHPPVAPPVAPPAGLAPPGAPAHVVPGSGLAVEGGYRLTDDDTSTWIAPDRDEGAWYALRIPNGWRDIAPLPGDELTLRSDGQATSVLGVQRLHEPGPLTVADAAALLAGRPGRRLVGPPTSDLVGGHPAVRMRAVEDTGGRPLAFGVLVAQVGVERLVVTAATDDLTGAELDLVDDVALGNLILRWLG